MRETPVTIKKNARSPASIQEEARRSEETGTYDLLARESRRKEEPEKQNFIFSYSKRPQIDLENFQKKQKPCEGEKDGRINYHLKLMSNVAGKGVSKGGERLTGTRYDPAGGANR